MSQTLTLRDEDYQDQQYTVNAGVKLPDGNGGFETFIQPSGSQSITQNGTFDVTDKASVVVNVPTGGGGPGWLPCSANYAWAGIYFNWEASGWTNLITGAPYVDGKCTVARWYSSEGQEPASTHNALVLLDLNGITGGTTDYGVAIETVLQVGTSGETTMYTPIFSTYTGETNISPYGESWSEDNPVKAPSVYGADTGSLVPLANFDDYVSGFEPNYWNYMWAGEEIAFGDYDTQQERQDMIDVIQNENVYLTQHIAAKCFYPGGIRDRFFYHNLNLESADIPGNLSYIGASAFEDCNQLTEVNIGKGAVGGYLMLNSIGEKAFYGCDALETVYINANSYITYYIHDYAFANCGNLAEVTIDATTPPTLGTDVFDTSGLVAIYVPASAVETYKTAAGWSNYASFIQAIPT